MRWTLLAVLALSCNGGGDKCKAYVVPSGTDLTSPVVSFKNDVLPIVTFSCTFSACHGTLMGVNNGVYLGERPPAMTNASTVVMGLLKPSGQLMAMPLVTASDPTRSYLMHKLDGDHCTLDKMCAGGSCGTSMPNGSPLLEIAKRDTVRRWIAQGAKDN